MLTLVVQPLKKSLAISVIEANGVIVKVSILKHVVDIIPYRLERYTELGVVVHHALGDGPIFIAPPALMESKSPIVLQNWLSDDVEVLMSNIRLSRSREEVQINASPQSSPGDIVRPQQHFHTVSIAEVDSMARRSIVRSLVVGVNWFRDQRCAVVIAQLKILGLQVKWMTAIQVRVNRISHVCCVNGPCQVISQPKTVNDFTKPIQIVILFLMCDQLDELILKNQLGSGGGKQDISGAVSGHVEAKAARCCIGPGENKVAGGHLAILLTRGGNIVGRQQVPALVLRGDMRRADVDMESFVGLILNCQI